MTVSEATFAAVDFESAGTSSGRTDVPVQIGLATLHDGRLDEGSRFVSYLHADSPITWAAQRVHGITADQLHGAPTLPSLWPVIRSTLGGRVVVAHGAATEKRYLRVFPFHGFGPWVDTLALARALRPGLSDYALGVLVGAWCPDAPAELASFCRGRTWHDALFDAAAALLLLRALIDGHRLGELEVDELVALGR